MKKSLVKNAAFNVVYHMLNVVFPLISVAYISRVLEPEGIGKVAYAQNIVSYFLMFAALGIPQYGTREIAKRQDSAEEINQLFSELLTVNFISTAICSIAYYIFTCSALCENRLLYQVCGLSLLLNFINVDWFFQGKEEYVYVALRSILVKTLSLAALLVFVKEETDCVAYALILCLGTGCNNIYNMFHIRKSVRLRLRKLNLRQHLQPVFALLISSIAAGLYNKVDVTMLGWLTDEASVGYYTNAHKVIAIVLTLVTAISGVFLPRLSYTYQHDREKFNEYLNVGLKIVLLLAVPGCLGLVIVADDIASVLFGPLFAPAADTIRILAAFTVIKGIGDLLCYQVVISTGNEKKLIKSRVVAGVANVIMNGILIPRCGFNGAALAAVISELIVNGMMLRYSLKIVRPRIERNFLLSLLLSTGVMGAAAVAVRCLLPCGPAELVAAVGGGAAVFGIMLILTKNEMALLLKRKIKKIGM